MQALEQYPYLGSNLLWLSCVLLISGIFFTPSHRRLIIYAGLLMMVSIPFGFFFEGKYWSPVRAGGWMFGIEDALCAFNTGATSCLASIFLLRDELILPERVVVHGRRFLGAASLIFAALLVLLSAGFSCMASLVSVVLVALVPLLLLRSDLWRFSLAGGIGFPLLYFGTIKVFFWIWPGFVFSWNNTFPWGTLLFGVPLGEITWAISFGLFWPLFLGFVFDLRLACSTRRQAALPLRNDQLLPGRQT